MAWQYFTDWLSSGDIVTSDQHKELYDAAIERIEAADGRAIGDIGSNHDRIEEFRDSTLYCLGGQSTFASLLDVLLTWSNRYCPARDSSNSWGQAGNPTIFEQALTDLGLSGVAQSIGDTSTLPTTMAYNIIRRVVMLMRWVDIGAINSARIDIGHNYPASSTSYGKEYEESSYNVAWGDVIDGFLAEAEGSGSLSANQDMLMRGIRSQGGGGSGTSSLLGGGYDVEFTIPSTLGVYDGREVEIFMYLRAVHSSNSPGTINDSAHFSGDFSVQEAVNDDDEVKVVTLSPDYVSDGNPINFRAALLSYTDKPTAQNYDPGLPSPAEPLSVQKSMVAMLRLAPTFAHPYEEISP